MNRQIATLLFTSTLLLGACGGPPPAEEQTKPAAAAQGAPATAPEMPVPTDIPWPRNPSPPGATMTIVSPTNGATLRSPVTVKFAVQGMQIAPAGSSEPNSGHYHLLVDAALPENLATPIPKDEHHVHFDNAQDEGQIELPPGPHTLQLLLGDGNHVAHDPPVYSPQVRITVE